MTAWQQQLHREAPDSIRQLILEALINYEYTIQKRGGQYLRMRSFNPVAVVENLQEYISSGRKLYLLQGPEIQGIKYQCCLRYDDGLIVYTKISKGDESDDESWHVILDFHDHNTGYPPLPE